MRSLALSLLLVLLSLTTAYSQIPIDIGIQILKAEDARRYDSVLENLMKSPDAAIRARAALAAGRIGDERAVPAIAVLLNDQFNQVEERAAFALGEIESIAGSEPILKRWRPDFPEERPSITGEPELIRPRLIEAMGKIAAANPDDPRSKDLSNTILRQLWELGEQAPQNREWILLGLTAVLRTKPEGAEGVVAKFLTNPDPRVRADAGNTLTRLKAKNANETLRHMVAADTDPVARANAARALGAAGDKEAVELLLKAATTDPDSRVRVSAVRSLGAIGDAKAADLLLERGKALLGNYATQKTENRHFKMEALEIAAALGRMLPNTGNANALKFLRELHMWGRYQDPETTIAWAQIDPKNFLDQGGLRIPDPHATVFDSRADSAYASGLAELAKSSDRELVNAAERRAVSELENEKEPLMIDHRAAPDKIRTLAAFKPGDISNVLRAQLKQDDVITRATAAELLADQPASNENIEALRSAWEFARSHDTHENDAQLAILDSLAKLAGRNAISVLSLATYEPDYIVRIKAAQLLKQFPGWSDTGTERSESWRQNTFTLRPYTPKNRTKLGQVLNTDADYRRALSRKNGAVKAVFNTQVGMFTIDLLPEDAPLTVDNFVKLARSGYFNGVYVHRVVPNFVMQDGDPRGDGNGGPGWSIRCEINMVRYDRGAVGMALSGKDTGGSQWFVTHSPQPHLDGGYTVFGKVNETDMKVVDNISRGDKIISVKIIEGGLTQRTRGTQGRKH